MTIQIFELTIKMVVENRQMKQADPDLLVNISKEELISECSEHVLKYIEQMKER